MDARLVKIIKEKSRFGNAVAQYLLGICYAKGSNGFELDLGVAYKLLRSAADKGHKKALKLINESYIIAGRHLIILNPIRKCIKVRERLLCEASVTREYLQQAYEEKITSFQDIWPEAYELYRHYLSFFCGIRAEAILDYFGDETYKRSLFNDLSKEFPSLDGWKAVLKILENIKGKFDKYQSVKESRPSSYGSFVGGGRGISGAISGAIKASLLNLAIDTAAGAVNQISDHNKLMDIANGFNALYVAIVEQGAYLNWFRDDTVYAIAIVMDELIRQKLLYNIDLESWIDNTPEDVVENIVSRSKTDINSKNKAVQDLLDLIQKKPYDHTLYVALCRVDSKYAVEVLDFMYKFQMEYFLLKRIYPNDEEIKYYEMPDFTLD